MLILQGYPTPTADKEHGTQEYCYNNLLLLYVEVYKL